MSLRIWLPLTKDLRNQGLDDVTVTNNGATFDANGKLGGCYKTSNSGDMDLKYSGAQINTGSLSLCGWFKFNKAELAATWGSYSFNSTRPNPTGNLIGNNSYGGVGLIWSTNSLVSGAAFTSLYVACSIRSTTNGARITSNIIIPFDTWVHLALVFNKDTKALELWLNGELKVTNAMLDFNDAKTDNLKLNYRATWGGNNPSYNIPFLVNDVRIYDHALSPLEVKHISQGLILHYPLSDKYIESTTNLSNSKLSSSCYNAVTKKYSYGTNTDIYKESGTFEGRVCEKVHMGTNGLDAFPYIFFDYFQPPVGETRTLSFDYYPTIMDKVVFYTYNSPGSGNYTINYKTPTSWSGSVTIPVQLNQWNHITITVTNTGSVANGYGYMQIGNVKHTSNTANYWLFGNIQVEAKDHATGYAGPNGTRNISTVYDCSGFCNNGIKWAYDTNGIIEIATDTPKYQISTYINSTNNTTNTASGTQYIYGDCMLTTPQYLTVAFWCKPIAGYGNNTGQGQFSLTNYGIGSAAGQDYDTSPMNHRDGLIDMCTSTGTHKTVSIAFTANEWHHYVIIYDGRYGRIYKDGTATGATLDMGSILSLKDMKGVVIGFSKAGGVWRSNKSYYSDFRIYVTALSADDVKSLYNNSAYIDNQGNIYGAVYEEV